MRIKEIFLSNFSNFDMTLGRKYKKLKELYKFRKLFDVFNNIFNDKLIFNLSHNISNSLSMKLRFVYDENFNNKKSR